MNLIVTLISAIYQLLWGDLLQSPCRAATRLAFPCWCSC